MSDRVPSPGVPQFEGDADCATRYPNTAANTQAALAKMRNDQQLDPDNEAEGFRQVAFNLVVEIIKSQRIWDFFRDKLAQRDTDAYSQHLGVADDLAWSPCPPAN